jgi:hypothetical protein
MASCVTTPEAVSAVPGVPEALGTGAAPKCAPVAVRTRVAAAAVGRRYPDPANRGREVVVPGSRWDPAVRVL